MAELSSKPVVLSVDVLDPTGAGGLSAAIETLFSLGCHCAPVAAVIAAGDTHSEKDRQIVEPALLIEQMRALLEDMDIALIRLGDLGNVENIEAVHTVLQDYPRIPVVLGTDTREHGALEATRLLLLPLTRLFILRAEQIFRFAPEADSSAAGAQAVLQYDCDHLLLTGSGNDAGLYSDRGLLKRSANALPGSDFIGAESTLAAAIGGYLAHGFSLLEAVQQGQTFATQATKNGLRLGGGHQLPDRMHWAG